MTRFQLLLAGCAAAAAAALCACYTPNLDDTGSDEARVEAVDPLEGAYAKQGGTPLHFVFRRGEAAEEDVFFGEIEVGGETQRAAGTAQVGRDNLGTTLTLQPTAAPSKTKAKDAGTSADASGTTSNDDAGQTDAGGGQPTDTRPLAQQAFSGTVHFLKIGKNDTLLVRGDENGKTAQYKKLRNWCGTGGKADCTVDVQRTGLVDCEDNLVCTATNKCACGR